MSLLAFALCLAAERGGAVPARGEAQPYATLDLYRPSADADKVLVPVELPDGSQELFIVDTGAATSAISREVADRLNLGPAVDAGLLMGLSGVVPWEKVVVPTIGLGGIDVKAVEFAVGVAGVPESLGALPVAGILGVNVWSGFGVVIDYPADVLELHPAGELRTSRRSSPMQYDGRSVGVPVRILAAHDGVRVKSDLRLELDTGAHDVLLLQATGEPFRAVSTAGEEPVLGIGVDLDDLPDMDLLQPTRRIPVRRVWIGGRRVDVDIDARWLYADESSSEHHFLPGLVGYEVLRNHRVVLDFAAGRLALTRSTRPPRDLDANAAWLARERLRPVPERAALRARLAWAADDEPGARAEVEQGLAARPDDPELKVLRAWLLRSEGRWDASIEVLATMTPGELASRGEWVSYVDALILEERIPEALAAARAALDQVRVSPDDEEDYLVALSDALLAAGEHAEAGAALEDASEASRKGRGTHLLRRARLAAAAGDRYGAMVPLRELIQNIPLQGVPYWLYAQLTEPLDVATYRRDVETALDRLHPGYEPWDFVGAGWLAVGEPTRAAEALAAGHARDCVPMEEGPYRANCDAWYWALGKERLPEAQARIREALEIHPDNASFLDTAAAVAWASGDAATAHAHAVHAARLHPDDPYLLWQVTRLTPTPSPAP